MPSARAISICRVVSRQIVFAFAHVCSSRARRFFVPEAPEQRLALVDRLLVALGEGDGDPALHALLQEERVRLERQVETAIAPKHLPHALKRLKQSLYPYQLEGVDRFFARGRLVLADADSCWGTTSNSFATSMSFASGLVAKLRLIAPRSVAEEERS